MRNKIKIITQVKRVLEVSQNERKEKANNLRQSYLGAVGGRVEHIATVL